MWVDELFDISKNDVDKHLSARDYLFIQDQKGHRKSTFGGKDLKLVKQLKRQLSKEVRMKKEEKHQKLSKHC